jgi:thioredoxin 1
MSIPHPKIITMAQIYDLILNNPGVIILKFGATWCGPCKRIEAQVVDAFSKMPPNVKCFMIDIDESSEIHSFFKKKRIINGVPAILAYFKENKHYIPDEFVSGANPPEINLLFQRCYRKAFE